MRRIICTLGIILLAVSAIVVPSHAQGRGNPTRQFIKTDAPVIALTHVKVIDGTGAAPTDDQTIVISGGKISWMGPAAKASIPAGAQVTDLTGYTVMPGMVGMHEHMFYPAGGQYNELSATAPKLYLACGVTTARTAGSLEPYTDLNLKQMIDDGRAVGPKMNVTGPYLEGPPGTGVQMHQLSGPDEARELVNYWAALGAGSFKAYMHITRAELSAAIAAAHQHNVKLTGHLCSIGFKEAAALGIDNLEHGLVVDTEFNPGKSPDVCPAQNDTFATIAKMDVEGPEIQQTIKDLVAHHVAITSTLPVFEGFVPESPANGCGWHVHWKRLLPEERIAYLEGRARICRKCRHHSLEYFAAIGNEIRARLRKSRWSSHCRSGSHRRRRRPARIRRSARSGASRRSWIHARRSHSHCNREWRGISRPLRENRHARAGKIRGHYGDSRRSGGAHHRHRKS